MLSVQRGHSVRYLTDEVAKAREGYYTGAVTAGEPPGVWWGAGAEKLGLSGEVDADLMEAIYTRLLDPRDPAAHDRGQWDDAAPLSAGHRKYRSAEEVYAGLLDTHPDAGPEERAQLRAQAARSARQAVAFIDVTLSPPKSVTITGLAFERAAQDARARGDFEAAEAWDAHAKAVDDAMITGARAGLAYLQEHAGYSRIGHHGGGSGRWIDAPNFVVAQFFQHDSRERDPQWHIHQAILNRVLCTDGVWRSIDGKAIDEHKAAAGALSERVIEAQLARSVGARVETRPDGKAREVIGVSRELIDLFSGRRAQIGPKAAQLVREFEAKVGRPPSPYERVVIHEQATLVTRKAKSHDGETRDEQFARWEEMARSRVTGGLAPLAEQLLQRAQDPGRPAEFSPRDVVERAVDAVAQTRAHYSRSDLFKAVSDALPGHLGVAPEEVLPLLDGLTDAAADLIQRLTPEEDTASLPPELRLANGESVYARHGSARFATPGQLAAEEALRAAAVERGAHQLSAEQVDEVVARFAESGVTLGVDQEAALRGVLTSGARVEVLTAAAGTGKSFVVGAIADSWTGRVFGLAPYQNAAEVLGGEGLATKNVAAWLATQARLDRPRPSVGPNGDDEGWRLRANDLVVVDEAGTAETGDLLAIWRRCAAVGAKLLLVGDPRQLSAIGPGGALSDIGRCGLTYQLAEVRRFANDWEGPASLRLRDGDPTVLAEYVKHGRLVAGGTAEQAEAMASRAWLADTLNGRESLLIVDTNAAAARVAATLRAELVRLGRVDEQGVPLGEGDDLAAWRGTVAGVGDLVEARALAWHLRRFEDNTAAPITRRTYRVLATREDGGLTVAPILERRAPDDTSDGWNVWGERLGAPMQLPGTYVHEHVSLGYACTKDSAQGRTVDTGHAVTQAPGCYVPATRGRYGNTLYAVTRPMAPDAETGETLDVPERAPEAVLADLLANIQDDRTALAEQEHAIEEARSVMTQVDRMVDLIREVNAGRLAGTLDRLAAKGLLTGHQRAQLAADDAFGSLERLLRTAELAGHDPENVLRAAVEVRDLHGVTSPARVLHHRITGLLTGRLTPRLREGIADLIPHHLRDAAGTGPDALRGQWLRERAEAAEERRHELGARIAVEAPAWAVDALGPVPDDTDPVQVIARQEWERRAGWAAAYRELVGYTDDHDALGNAPGQGRVEHAMMFRAAHEALASVETGEEEANLTVGRLRARVQAWEHEQIWAPRWVDDELAAVHNRRDQLTADATLWAAHADAPDVAAEDAEQLRADAAAAREEAEELAAQIALLEYADAGRSAWFAHTAVTRDNAERARFELRARGVDIDHPADLTTAEQWLTAHRAEQDERERDAEITEDDVLDDAPETPRPDATEDLVEVAPQDIRETAVPNASEKTDDPDRRRRPTLDETSITVRKAQETLAEIARRRAADAEREVTEAADREAAEAARREELLRWADTPTAERDQAVDGDDLADDVLTREG